MDNAVEVNPPPASVARPQPVNRLLGATSGASDGNVRALLAITGDLALHGLIALLLVAYFRGSAGDLKDLIVASSGTVLGLDVAAVSYYFGKRSGETG